MAIRGPHRSYDHRLRDFVRQSGDPGIATRVPQELETRRSVARKARLEQNRARSCPECMPLGPAAAGAA